MSIHVDDMVSSKADAKGKPKLNFKTGGDSGSDSEKVIIKIEILILIIFFKSKHSKEEGEWSTSEDEVPKIASANIIISNKLPSVDSNRKMLGNDDIYEVSDDDDNLSMIVNRQKQLKKSKKKYQV